MTLVGIKELKARASEIIKSVRMEQESVVITCSGKPCALITPLTDEELEDYILTSHPRFVKMRKDAEEAAAKGEFVTADELKQELEKV